MEKPPEFFLVKGSVPTNHTAYAASCRLTTDSGEVVKLLQFRSGSRDHIRLAAENDRLTCHAEFDNTEGQWHDAMYCSAFDPTLVVSDRIHNFLVSEGIGSFKAFEAIAHGERSLHRGTFDELRWCIIPSPGIDVVREEVRGRLVRFKAVPDSWEGDDLFSYRGLCICTMRFLELARKQRWTNFRFVPLDAFQPAQHRWPGLEYLGRAWPPREWYPPLAPDEMTVEEWVETYMDNLRHPDLNLHDEERRRPMLALKELAPEAIPVFLEILGEQHEEDRLRAACVLATLSQDEYVDDTGFLDEVIPLLIDDLKTRESATAARLLLEVRSLVNVEQSILDIAAELAGRPDPDTTL